MKRITVLTMVFVFVIALISAGQAQGHQKSSWYIGFGIGTGNGSYETEGGTSLQLDEFAGTNNVDYAPRVSINFGLGAILSPEMHLGFDVTALRATADSSTGSASASVQINNYMAMLTWFPMSEGLFVRAGAGGAVMQAEFDSGTYSTSESYGGYCLLGGVGYAFWIGDTFNLAINFDYSQQNYGEEIDSSKFWNLYVSFYWF